MFQVWDFGDDMPVLSLSTPLWLLHSALGLDLFQFWEAREREL